MNAPGSLHGVYPYLVTPLDDRGQLDEVVVERMVQRCLKAGVHGVTPLGSSGELPLVPNPIRQEMIRAVVEFAGGAVPVVAGIGAFDTRSAIESALAAEDAGVDGILAVLFNYFPMSGSEAVAYFSAVARAVSVPVVIYYHPQFCRFELRGSDLAVLAQTDNIRFIKDASGVIANVSKWRTATDDRIQVFASTSFSPAAAMLLGAVGWMSGPATILPLISSEIYALCRDGKWQDAVELEQIIEPVLQTFRTHGPARTVKAFLRVQGLDPGSAIPPLAELSKAHMDAVHATWSSVATDLEAAGYAEPEI